MADKFGNPSLEEALNNFVAGAKDYGISRAVSDAQDRIQEIKTAGLKDAEQRRAVGDVTQKLISNMVGMGADAAHIEQTRLAMAPKQFGTPNEMFAAGLASGDPGTMKDAKDFQKFEEESAIRIAHAKHRMENPNEVTPKALGKYADWATGVVNKTNEDTVRAGNNALLQKSKNKIAEMHALLEQAKMTNMAKAEINAGMSSIFNQGAATVEGTKGADIHTFNSLVAQFKQPFSNDVQQYEAPDLIKYYNGVVNRMEGITNNLLQRSHERTANKLAAGALKDPTPDKKYFKQTISSLTGYDPSDIEYDPAKGVSFRSGALPVHPVGENDNNNSNTATPSQQPAMTAPGSSIPTFLRPITSPTPKASN